ncbi:MAG: NAD-dependent epimerase/dehydratase family protein [Bacteroidetes bacterium]|nr:NAD-dependent epimerase/dehydratase family protein [Bacteroidota bacterium]
MVLVTGASGFLGQHLVRALSAQGERVRALYNNNAPGDDLKDLPGINWQKYDLLDVYEVAEAMKDITHVYHCAAIISFDPKRKEEMIHFNVEATANIVNQALEQDIEKLVYVSSIAALGRSEDVKKEINEDEAWEESKYNSGYGLSKYLAEMEVWRGIGEGLNAAVVNPGTILGETNSWHDGSAHIMKIVYKQFPFYTPGVTSWVDVHDVVKAVVMLMQSNISDERFILSAGNYSFKEIFTMMAGALNRRAPRIEAGRFLSGLTWRAYGLRRLLTGKPSIITRESAEIAQKHSYYDNTKFRSFFPAFSYTPIHETISNMSAAFLQTGIKKA